MKYVQRMDNAVVLTADLFPGYAVINPFPGLFIPVVKHSEHAVEPCMAFGERSACWWFALEESAWEHIAGMEASPLAPKKPAGGDDRSSNGD